MSIVAAIALSMFLLTMAGCMTAGDPSVTKQAAGKKDLPVKPAKHDEKRSMNEESMNAVQ